MAKGDILQITAGSSIPANGVEVTFSTAPASGNLILIFCGNTENYSQTLSGFTNLGGAGPDANIVAWAKVAGGSEPTSYTVTLGADWLNRGAVGVVIEGPFSDLTDVVAYAGTSGLTTNTIPSSAQSVSAGTWAFAATSQWGLTPPSSFSNSFGNAVSHTAGGANGTTVARRQYTSGSSGDVQTVATWGASQDATAGVLVLVPYGGGASGPSKSMSYYYRTLGVT
jgi:hypothetical protein